MAVSVDTFVTDHHGPIDSPRPESGQNTRSYSGPVMIHTDRTLDRIGFIIVDYAGDEDRAFIDTLLAIAVWVKSLRRTADMDLNYFTLVGILEACPDRDTTKVHLRKFAKHIHEELQGKAG